MQSLCIWLSLRLLLIDGGSVPLAPVTVLTAAIGMAGKRPASLDRDRQAHLRYE